jgi:hypothetical protein
MVNNNTNNNGNSKNNNNDNASSIDSMSPAELKAYYRGLKRGISLTFVTMTLREATMLNYARYPQLRFIRGEPMLAAQDLIDQAFVGMKQAKPTPQEISLYDILTQEYGINILSSLMGMNTTNPGVKDATTNAAGRPKLPSPGNLDSTNKRQTKIPYDREKVRNSGAFELSKEQKEELK